jgi:hypothetical protein
VRVFALVAVVACSPAPREMLDVLDAAPDAELAFERRVNQVLVGDSSVIWVAGDNGPCSLEFGCSDKGTARTTWSRSSSTVVDTVEDGVGSLVIAGTDQSYFVVTGSAYSQMAVHRISGGVDTTLSPPRAGTVGPALDTDSVYWADSSEPNQLHYKLWRAARNGDGSDATLVADLGESLPRDLAYAGGYLWWQTLALSHLERIPVAGGPVESLDTDGGALAVHNDVLYLRTWRSNGDGTWATALGRMRDTTFEPITTWGEGESASYIVPTDDDLYWSKDDGNVYRIALTGGAIRTFVAQDDAGYAFAVLPDQLLVGFTHAGFRSIPL